MSLLGQTYFWTCAIVAVLGALATITAANPVRGAMGLLVTILSIAGLFLALHAQFLAAIQLIVYAGAVVVLFLFVIMMLGPSATAPGDNRGRVVRYFSAALFAGSSIGAMGLLVRTAPHPPPVLGGVDNDFGGIDAFGRTLFSQGVVPFELSSALLMVAVIGAVAVARGRPSRGSGAARSEGMTKDGTSAATPAGGPHKEPQPERAEVAQ